MVDLEIEDPLIKETQILGKIDRSKMLETFADFDWAEMNRKLREGNSAEFFHSPTMYFKDRENDMEICFSLVGESKEFDFLVFFVRTKTAKGFLGFGTKDKKVVSDQEHGFENSKAILKEFINLDLEALESMF